MVNEKQHIKDKILKLLYDSGGQTVSGVRISRHHRRHQCRVLRRFRIDRVSAPIGRDHRVFVHIGHRDGDAGQDTARLIRGRALDRALLLRPCGTRRALVVCMPIADPPGAASKFAYCDGRSNRAKNRAPETRRISHCQKESRQNQRSSFTSGDSSPRTLPRIAR